MIDMTNIMLMLGAIVLVFVNAFFVAAEFGMVKLRATRVETIKDNYGLRGKILYQVHNNMDAYLSACQLGITLASLGLGWIGEPAFSDILQPIFGHFEITSPHLVKAAAFISAFAIITFLHIVVGELMPKSIAIRRPEIVSMWTAIPLYTFYWIMHPFILILNTCSNTLLKIIRLNMAPNSDDTFYSSNEIKLVLSASHAHGELTKEETEIMEHTIELGDLIVTEIMRPPAELIMLNSDDSIKICLEKMNRYSYSRYPIYDKTKQEIVGIVHVKNVFARLSQQEKITDITSIMRPILKVSHRLPAMNLLRKFREGTTHLALVYENREMVGFVTLDNLLHVMLGKITDEFHRTHDDWVANSDGTIYAKGSCSLYSLEQALDRDIFLEEDEEDFDTISDLIMHRLTAPAKPGDKISTAEFDATIEEMNDESLQKILIMPKKIN